LIHERKNCWVVDKLLDNDAINKKLGKRENWYRELNKRLSKVGLFTNKYIDTLQNKCGSVFCKEWTENICLK
jgi:hypothetical protein